MQAFVCDICGKIETGLPVGVFYDNTISRGKDRAKDERRTDICKDCLDEVAQAIGSIRDNKGEFPPM